MISLRITHIKDFMQKLLSSDAFDLFLLEEATVHTYNAFTIDGHILKDFFSQEDIPQYGLSLWKDMRPLCFQLIKGKRTPLSFKFVLHLMPEYANKILEKGDSAFSAEQLQAYVLTVRYDGSAVSLITGTCYKSFHPDKEPERLWEQAVRLFLAKKEIEYEEGG